MMVLDACIQRSAMVHIYPLPSTVVSRKLLSRQSRIECRKSVLAYPF